MIKELWTSLKEGIQERLSSPMLGTFLIVWVIHNWEISLLLLKSNKPIEQTIKNIQTNHSNFQDIFLTPAGLSLAILIIYPFLSSVFFGLSEAGQSIKNKIKRKFSVWEWKSPKDFKKVLSDYHELRDKSSEERKKLSDEIIEKEIDLKTAREELVTIRKTNEKLKKSADEFNELSSSKERFESENAHLKKERDDLTQSLSLLAQGNARFAESLLQAQEIAGDFDLMFSKHNILNSLEKTKASLEGNEGFDVDQALYPVNLMLEFLNKKKIDFKDFIDNSPFYNKDEGVWLPSPPNTSPATDEKGDDKKLKKMIQKEHKDIEFKKSR